MRRIVHGDQRGRALIIVDYIQAALDVAHYEIIDDPEPYYGEVRALPGVYATGDTLQACRQCLSEVIEGWLIISLKQTLPIPTINGVTIEPYHEAVRRALDGYTAAWGNTRARRVEFGLNKAGLQVTVS